MTSYKDMVTADLRLTVLRLLAATDGYELSGSLLRMALEDYAHRVGIDRLKGQLAWLEEQGLLAVRETGGVAFARLSPRGLDVAAGRARVPGVARPEPEGDL